MKMRSWYKTVVLAVAASALTLSVQAQKIVYDASTSTAPQFLSSTNEFGDQIKLAGSGPLDRTIAQFKMEYYLSRYVNNNEKAVLRIYDNTGNEPGELLWESGPVQLRYGYNTIVVSDLKGTDGNPLVVPDWITWTVSFSGIDANETAGLMLRDPATVGDGYTDFWEKDATGWHTKVLPDTQVTFGAQVVAVPEPATIQLALVGALGLMGSLAMRRRSAK